jgi:glucosamine-6-phosphate deaminase
MSAPYQFATPINAGTIKLEIHPTGKAAGEAAARATAEELRRLGQLGNSIGVIFATGASQLDTLDALTSIPDLPWSRVQGFHLDEYVALVARQNSDLSSNQSDER